MWRMRMTRLAYVARQKMKKSTHSIVTSYQKELGSMPMNLSARLPLLSCRMGVWGTPQAHARNWVRPSARSHSLRRERRLGA